MSQHEVRGLSFEGPRNQSFIGYVQPPWGAECDNDFSAHSGHMLPSVWGISPEKFAAVSY